MYTEIDEKFYELLKVDSLEECQAYIIILYANFKINDRDFDYYMGIICGFRMCCIDYEMIIGKSST